MVDMVFAFYLPIELLTLEILPYLDGVSLGRLSSVCIFFYLLLRNLPQLWKHALHHQFGPLERLLCYLPQPCISYVHYQDHVATLKGSAWKSCYAALSQRSGVSAFLQRLQETLSFIEKTTDLGQANPVQGASRMYVSAEPSPSSLDGAFAFRTHDVLRHSDPLRLAWVAELAAPTETAYIVLSCSTMSTLTLSLYSTFKNTSIKRVDWRRALERVSVWAVLYVDRPCDAPADAPQFRRAAPCQPLDNAVHQLLHVLPIDAVEVYRHGSPAALRDDRLTRRLVGERTYFESSEHTRLGHLRLRFDPQTREGTLVVDLHLLTLTDLLVTGTPHVRHLLPLAVAAAQKPGAMSSRTPQLDQRSEKNNMRYVEEPSALQLHLEVVVERSDKERSCSFVRPEVSKLFCFHLELSPRRQTQQHRSGLEDWPSFNLSALLPVKTGSMRSLDARQHHVLQKLAFRCGLPFQSLETCSRLSLHASITDSRSGESLVNIVSSQTKVVSPPSNSNGIPSTVVYTESHVYTREPPAEDFLEERHVTTFVGNLVTIQLGRLGSTGHQSLLGLRYSKLFLRDIKIRLNGSQIRKLLTPARYARLRDILTLPVSSSSSETGFIPARRRNSHQQSSHLQHVLLCTQPQERGGGQRPHHRYAAAACRCHRNGYPLASYPLRNDEQQHYPLSMEQQQPPPPPPLSYVDVPPRTVLLNRLPPPYGAARSRHDRDSAQQVLLPVIQSSTLRPPRLILALSPDMEAMLSSSSSLGPHTALACRHIMPLSLIQPPSYGLQRTKPSSS